MKLVQNKFSKSKTMSFRKGAGGFRFRDGTDFTFGKIIETTLNMKRLFKSQKKHPKLAEQSVSLNGLDGLALFVPT